MPKIKPKNTDVIAFMFYPIKLAVITATSINTHVETQERVEKRDIPHTPCPLVQPLASEVPTPTKSPATIINQEGIFKSPSNNSGAINEVATPAISKPAIKHTFHTLSDFNGVNSDLTNPEIPATLPNKTSNSAQAMPIKAPPKAAEMGVNSVTILNPPNNRYTNTRLLHFN